MRNVINMGKRIGTVLLAGLLAFSSMQPMTAVDVPAEETSFYQTLLGVECLGGMKLETAFRDQNGIWYLSADTISRYSGYTFDDNSDVFSKGNGTFKKSIAIDWLGETVTVNGYVNTLTGAYNWNGELYLPIHQIFPLMEMVCEVENGTLSLSQASMTLAEAMDGFSMDSVWFDGEREFDGKDWAKETMVGLSWLYDTVSQLDIDRLVLWSNNPEDYQVIYEEYLVDQEAYQEAFNQAQSKVFDSAVNPKTAISIAKGSLDFLQYAKEFFDWLDPMDVTHTTQQMLYRFVPKAVVEAGKDCGIFLSGINRGVTMYLNYGSMVTDHVEMLRTVYPEIGGTPAASDVKLWKIKDLYDVYLDFDYHEIAEEMMETIVFEYAKDGLEPFLFGPVSIYVKGAAMLTRAGMNWFHKEIGIGDSSGMALLNYHLGALEDARDKYNLYLERKDQEATRLSAIMTLVISKRCYEIMRDNSAKDEELENYYNTRIDTVKKYLAKFYLAKEGVMADGTEFYQTAESIMKEMFTGLAERKVYANDTIWWEFYNAYYDMEDINSRVFMADLTGDGIEEMILADYRGDGCVFEVFTLRDGSPKSLYRDIVSRGEMETAMFYAKGVDGRYGLLRLKYKESSSAFNLYTAASYQWLVFNQDGTYQEADSMSWQGDSGTYDLIVNVLTGYAQRTLDDNITFGEKPTYLMHTSDKNMRGYTNIYFYFGYLEETQTQAEQMMIPSNAQEWANFLSGIQNNGMNKQVRCLFYDLTWDGVDDLILVYEQEMYGDPSQSSYYVDVYTMQDGSPTYLIGDYADLSDGSKARIWLCEDHGGRKPGLLSERPEWRSPTSYYSYSTMVMGYLEWADGIYAFESEFHDQDILLIDTMSEQVVLGGRELSEWMEILPEPVITQSSSGLYPEMEAVMSSGWWEGMFAGEYYSFWMQFGTETHLYIQKSGSTEIYDVPVTLETGTDISIRIYDNGSLEAILPELSPDFSGGGYSVQYNPESRSLLILTNAGAMMELYFFGG